MRPIASAVVLLALASTSHAGTVTYSTDISTFGQPGSVPLFSLGGNLNSVRVDFSGVGGAAYVGIFEPFTAYTIAPSASVFLGAPGLFEVIDADPVAASTVTLAAPEFFVFPGFAFAGSWEFAGDLGRFVGAGNIGVQVGGGLGFDAPIFYDVAFDNFGNFQGSLAITYGYDTLSVPEPSSLVLSSVAAIIVAASSRCNRRSRRRSASWISSRAPRM